MVQTKLADEAIIDEGQDAFAMKEPATVVKLAKDMAV